MPKSAQAPKPRSEAVRLQLLKAASRNRFVGQNTNTCKPSAKAVNEACSTRKPENIPIFEVRDFRINKHEMPFGTQHISRRYYLHVSSGKRSSVFLRICTSGGRQKHLGVCFNAIQIQKKSPQQKSHVAAKKSTIFVHLVDHDISQITQESSAFRVPVPRLPTAQKRHIQVFGISEQGCGKDFGEDIP